MSESIAHYRDAYQRSRPALPGAGVEWMDSARERAMAHFESTGFPSPREEDWKYTRTAAIEKVAFSSAASTSGVDANEHVLALGGPCLVFVDGRFDSQASSLSSHDGQPRILDLANAVEQESELLSAHLNHYANSECHAFTALNTALAQDGALIHAARNQTSESPVQLLFLSSGEQDSMAHPRVLIVAEEGSALTVVEHYVGLASSKYMNNVVTEVSVGANASVTHYKVQRDASSAFHMSTLQVHQHADSRFTSHSISLGAAIARHDINIDLAGRGAECRLNGLYLASGRQHVDYHTRVDHRVEHCNSFEDYKGVLSGRGRGVFNGRVIVHKGAQKTDAHQSNKNLLLSADAEVDTKPQLEIYADDVKCAHGATVGQLDERMVFYLRSRGIGEPEARALLTYGFACDVVDRMKLEPLRSIVTDALLDQIPLAGELRSILK